jgi:protein-tyrosine-phosphatase
MSQAVERAVVAVARRLQAPAGAVLGRARVRSLLRGRALRAWRSTDAPLILCYGNINRSAFATALAQRAGRVGAFGGGFYPQEGRPAPSATIACAAAYGVDLTGHRSRCVTSAELAGAPAIFVFDLENVARVAARHPSALARTHLRGALDGDARMLIADPHGRPAAELERTVARIARAVGRAEGGT